MTAGIIVRQYRRYWLREYRRYYDLWMTKDTRRLPLTDWQLEDSDRLKALFKQKRGELKLTQEKIAAELGDGVTQGAVSHFMNRRTALSLRAATVFAKMLQVPVSDISPTLASQLTAMSSSLASAIPGVGSLIRTTLGLTPTFDQQSAATPLPAGGEADEAMNDRYAYIPQYTAMAAAGDGHDNPHVEVRSTLAFKKEWLRIKGVKAENLQVIYANGDSMMPTINDHDVLLVDSSRVEPADGGVFVVESTTDGTLVKRLVKGAMGSWTLRSDNEDKEKYKDRSFLRSESNEHRIVGRVIWRGGDL